MTPSIYYFDSHENKNQKYIQGGRNLILLCINHLEKVEYPDKCSLKDFFVDGRD